MLNQEIQQTNDYLNLEKCILLKNISKMNIEQVDHIKCKQKVMVDVNHEEDVSHLFATVGLLRMNWYNNSNLQTINYGTAFAVSDRILITCTHNIYSEKKRQFCTQTLFIPNINRGQNYIKFIYQSAENNDEDKFYQCPHPKSSFSYQPLQEQLTLVVLQSPLPTRSFIKIGTIENDQQKTSKTLKIIGYPSKNYWEYSNLYMVQPDRKVLSGNLFQIDRHIIKHTMKTSVGMSGSPILSKNAKGQYMAVGIHTHKGLGRNYNSGLFFNDKMIKQIQQFQSRLKLAFNLISSIEYAYKVQEEYDQDEQSSMQSMRALNLSSQQEDSIDSQSQISEKLKNIYRKQYLLEENSSYDESEEQSDICLYQLMFRSQEQQQDQSMEQDKSQEYICSSMQLEFDRQQFDYFLKQQKQQKQNNSSMEQEQSQKQNVSLKVQMNEQIQIEIQKLTTSSILARQDVEQKYSKLQNNSSDLTTVQKLSVEFSKSNLNIDRIVSFEQRFIDASIQKVLQYLQLIFEINQKKTSDFKMCQIISRNSQSKINRIKQIKNILVRNESQSIRRTIYKQFYNQNEYLIFDQFLNESDRSDFIYLI